MISSEVLPPLTHREQHLYLTRARIAAAINLFQSTSYVPFINPPQPVIPTYPHDEQDDDIVLGPLFPRRRFSFYGPNFEPICTEARDDNQCDDQRESQRPLRAPLCHRPVEGRDRDVSSDEESQSIETKDMVRRMSKAENWKPGIKTDEKTMSIRNTSRVTVSAYHVLPPDDAIALLAGGEESDHTGQMVWEGTTEWLRWWCSSPYGQSPFCFDGFLASSPRRPNVHHSLSTPAEEAGTPAALIHRGRVSFARAMLWNGIVHDILQHGEGLEEKDNNQTHLLIIELGAGSGLLCLALLRSIYDAVRRRVAENLCASATPSSNGLTVRETWAVAGERAAALCERTVSCVATDGSTACCELIALNGAAAAAARVHDVKEETQPDNGEGAWLPLRTMYADTTNTIDTTQTHPQTIQPSLDPSVASSPAIDFIVLTHDWDTPLPSQAFSRATNQMTKLTASAIPTPTGGLLWAVIHRQLQKAQLKSASGQEVTTPTVHQIKFISQLRNTDPRVLVGVDSPDSLDTKDEGGRPPFSSPCEPAPSMTVDKGGDRNALRGTLGTNDVSVQDSTIIRAKKSGRILVVSADVVYCRAAVKPLVNCVRRIVTVYRDAMAITVEEAREKRRAFRTQCQAEKVKEGTWCGVRWVIAWMPRTTPTANEENYALLRDEILRCCEINEKDTENEDNYDDNEVARERKAYMRCRIVHEEGISQENTAGLLHAGGALHHQSEQKHHHNHRVMTIGESSPPPPATHNGALLVIDCC